MNKLTIKQERFYDLYIELGNASEAYKKSYDCKNMSDKTVYEAASRLLNNGKIVARLQAAKEQAAKRHNITLDDLLDELIENRQLAKECGQAAAATSATMAKAKLLGLDVTKVDHTSVDGSFKAVFNFEPVAPKGGKDESGD